MYLTKSYPASGFNRLSRALSSLSIVSLELMKGPTSESPTPTSSIVYLGQCLTPSLTLNKRLSLLALILTGRGAVVLIRQTMARMGYCSSCFGSGRGGKLQNGIIAEGGIAPGAGSGRCGQWRPVSIQSLQLPRACTG